MSACIFCKIIKNEIPAKKAFENESFIVIQDIHPQAKIHYLIIPKTHAATLDELEKQSPGQYPTMTGDWMSVALQIARSLNVQKSGYRLVLNQGSDGGQTVFHLHLHLLAGEHLSGEFA